MRLSHQLTIAGLNMVFALHIKFFQEDHIDYSYLALLYIVSCYKVFFNQNLYEGIAFLMCCNETYMPNKITNVSKARVVEIIIPFFTAKINCLTGP